MTLGEALALGPGSVVDARPPGRRAGRPARQRPRDRARRGRRHRRGVRPARDRRGHAARQRPGRRGRPGARARRRSTSRWPPRPRRPLTNPISRCAVGWRTVAVHSALPEAMTRAVDVVLRVGRVPHVAHGDGDPLAAAERAAADPAALALIGPMRSADVAEARGGDRPGGPAGPRAGRDVVRGDPPRRAPRRRRRARAARRLRAALRRARHGGRGAHRRGRPRGRAPRARRRRRPSLRPPARRAAAPRRPAARRAPQPRGRRRARGPGRRAGARPGRRAGARCASSRSTASRTATCCAGRRCASPCRSPPASCRP